MSNNIVLIAAVEAEAAAREAGDVPLRDRALAAMRATRNHWMATAEMDQFNAACEGLARVVTDEERERIVDDLHRLKVLEALLSGVPVDMDKAVAEAGSDAEPLGLMGLWHSTAEAR